jgi:hypothetical protein
VNAGEVGAAILGPDETRRRAAADEEEAEVEIVPASAAVCREAPGGTEQVRVVDVDHRPSLDLGLRSACGTRDGVRNASGQIGIKVGVLRHGEIMPGLLLSRVTAQSLAPATALSGDRRRDAIGAPMLDRKSRGGRRRSSSSASYLLTGGGALQRRSVTSTRSFTGYRDARSGTGALPRLAS